MTYKELMAETGLTRTRLDTDVYRCTLGATRRPMCANGCARRACCGIQYCHDCAMKVLSETMSPDLKEVFRAMAAVREEWEDDAE